jgi:hypothetical protein
MVPSYLRFLHEYRNAHEVIEGDDDIVLAQNRTKTRNTLAMIPSYLRFLHKYGNDHEVIVGDGEVNIGCFGSKFTKTMSTGPCPFLP